MKHFGSVCEFAEERADDLLKAYFVYIRSCHYLRMDDLLNAIVNMPASRFWISAPRAAVVISSMDRGDALEGMRPNKREMFREIYRRYLSLRGSFPNAPVARLVRIVVSQPAPKFYMSPSSAKIIILKARKSWFREKSRKH